ncbi:8-amino-7-oxononanoate synthase [Cronobacter turicensis]|uniref:8-amino-7-oxononanoate synthase n=1 Tax=Cronobacter turicensis (strain DSM 18703 / CCUG 55852 / LMG 23827 / z3032) TaxID=693216 RepID=C9XZE6_CROTZ|nr:8-amino-7-oxononanoate synthase [Cronobacter turicensis]CBA29354.1 8-amino-7-oxononanoate synthase [Cronobacter turicensis z3032]EGT5682922.1 8-amino-7-oxononanoate synthase [Cronobacter turicensis]EGT5739295.1 8-amino-7-oxononanoate synthase [Cronobacter turicensis]EKM0374843.1 8-amino-7-oxononanoate synthase [Cronobacter turicensis]EKM5063098.1 8-amino-7-oxononanoate synthase [Cronobacter turicensis]
MTWQARIDTALRAREASHSLRRRVVCTPAAGGALVHQGVRYRNFSGNDYLGLSQHPALIAAWRQGAEMFGVGSGASGHVSGYSGAHQSLENALAQWLGFDRALLFISGFAANQAVVAALMQQPDRILADRLSHASLLEAASHSPATLRRFAHNAPGALAALLDKPCDGLTLVFTEGVFSMDGDRAPLADIAGLAQSAQTLLMVDDAHGIGVLGREGRGSCDVAGVRPDLLLVTFGKAFGLSGAALLCSESMADYLLQTARHLIYSTAMPAAQACALDAALTVVREGDDLRARLARNITRFRAGASQLPLTLADSQTAIQPLIVGENSAALTLAEKLRERGCWATAIRPPTVPAGTARLRLTLSAAHQDDDIDALLEALYDGCR